MRKTFKVFYICGRGALPKRMAKPTTEKENTKILKKIKKTLDKRLKVCYNDYSKERNEVIRMEFDIYVNGCCISKTAISGCEFIGETWVKAQKLAEMLGVSCALVNAETGEVVVWWEP